MAYDELLRNITLDADASVGIYTGVPGQPGSANPNGGKQYHAVKVTGTGTVGIVSAVTDEVVGILQNKPQKVGAAATVAIAGVSRVVADKAVAAGAKVYLSADGQGTDAAGGSATQIGVAITPALNAGEIFAVLLKIA